MRTTLADESLRQTLAIPLGLVRDPATDSHLVVLLAVPVDPQIEVQPRVTGVRVSAFWSHVDELPVLVTLFPTCRPAKPVLERFWSLYGCPRSRI